MAKIEDILHVNQNPYDPQHPQVCLDEIQKVLRLVCMSASRQLRQGASPPRPFSPLTSYKSS
ncbi:MAG: hypothetical protein ACK2T1_09630 [Candidatus Promineifilaceae bacterium]